MYDQEPLSDHALSTYKYRLRWGTRTRQQHLIDQASFGEMFGCWTFSGTFPICCHSERNSAEVASLQQHLVVPCYYWYHAFIARDWYRYWERHRLLAAKNKSTAPYRFLLYARDHTATRSYRKHLIEQLSVHKDSILYDWHNTRSVPASYSATIDIDDANQAGVHLVAETLFETNKIQLTEKVFKPMVMNQPFIVWSAPGTLAYLREYGFKTFDHVWSEAYDQETDHSRRMQMLIDLVCDLAAMPADQYHSLYEKCLPVIEHNRERFYSSRFMDHCWQELETNWQQAIDQRQELLEELPGGVFINILHRNRDLASVGWYPALVENLLSKMDAETRVRVLARCPEFNEL